MNTLAHQHIKTIGVFRALQLGDMLCVIPAIRAIKLAYPEADITLIGLPWQRNLVKRFPQYFADFMEFPGWPGLPEREFAAADVVKFLVAVQQRKFDLVLQMQGDGSIVNPMCMLFGAKNLAGYTRKGDFCPDKDLFPVIREDEHEIIRFLRLAETIGAPRQGTDLEFPISSDELEQADKIRQALELVTGKYICLHPGARDPRRRWAPENFAFIGDELASRGFTIILTGSEEEGGLLKKVAASMRYPVIDLVGRFGQVGLGELSAIIGDAAMLFSNDTGVSHIAAALKVPSVIIFSPYSDPQRWAPLDTTLHLTISAEQAGDPSGVLRTVLNHVEKTCVSV